MYLRAIFIIGVALGVAACGQTEQAEPEAPDEAPMAALDAGNPAVWRNEAFVAHMHLHAEKLDDLNFALADGNLAAAKEAADWLATHDSESDIQADWMPHLYRMRTEAEAVAAAPDIETAQAASLRITAQCQECHAAVGINAR